MAADDNANSMSAENRKKLAEAAIGTTKVKALQRHVAQWLKKDGLKQEGQGSYTYNERFKCWEYRFKLAGTPQSAELLVDDDLNPRKDLQLHSSADGREVVVKFFDENSNTEQDSIDYQNRCNSIATAALYILNHPGIKADSEQAEKIRAKQKEINKKLAACDPTNESDHEEAMALMKDMTRFSASLLKKLAKRKIIKEEIFEKFSKQDKISWRSLYV